MKLVTFRQGAEPRLGAQVDGGIVDLTAAGVAATMTDLIEAGAAGLEKARAALNGPRLPLSSVTLDVPVRPGKVLCCGINYKSHAAENPKAVMPSEPFFFAKLSSSVVGTDTPVRHPPKTQQMDYEIEFAVVIGRRLSRASEADIMPAIFGYTLLNDLSARDVQFKDNQITLGKNFDGFSPIGPCIVTTDEMTAPDRVRLLTRLNGKVMQDGNTADWLFPLPRLLSALSQVMTLEPGDVISTGTPAGVGLFRSPQVFMQPDDVVEIEAEGIGVLRTPIIA